MLVHKGPARSRFVGGPSQSPAAFVCRPPFDMGAPYLARFSGVSGTGGLATWTYWTLLAPAGMGPPSIVGAAPLVSAEVTPSAGAVEGAAL